MLELVSWPGNAPNERANHPPLTAQKIWLRLGATRDLKGRRYVEAHRGLTLMFVLMSVAAVPTAAYAQASSAATVTRVIDGDTLSLGWRMAARSPCG